MRNIILLGLLSFAACKTTKNLETSDVDFGAVPFLEKTPKMFLPWMKPGAKVPVCGYRFVDLALAAYEWAAAVGRHHQLDIQLLGQTCPTFKTESHEAFPIIGVKAWELPEGDPARCEDEKKYAAYASGDKRGHIYFCRPDSQMFIPLHEVGHLWGLCDQYKTRVDGEIRHPVCLGKQELTYHEKRRVMGHYEDGLALYPDDIVGARAITRRRSFLWDNVPSGNVTKGWDYVYVPTGWKRVFAHEIAPENQLTFRRVNSFYENSSLYYDHYDLIVHGRYQLNGELFEVSCSDGTTSPALPYHLAATWCKFKHRLVFPYHRARDLVIEPQSTYVKELHVRPEGWLLASHMIWSVPSHEDFLVTVRPPWGKDYTVRYNATDVIPFYGNHRKTIGEKFSGFVGSQVGGKWRVVIFNRSRNEPLKLKEFDFFVEFFSKTKQWG